MDTHLALTYNPCDSCAVLHCCDFSLVFHGSFQGKGGQFIEICGLVVAEEGVLLVIANQIHNNIINSSPLYSVLPFSLFSLHVMSQKASEKNRRQSNYTFP